MKEIKIFKNGRESRGFQLFMEGRVKALPEAELFQVENGRGKTYVVDLKEETCNCPDFLHRGGRCKHIWAVIFFEETNGKPVEVEDYETSIRRLIEAPVKTFEWEENVI